MPRHIEQPALRHSKPAAWKVSCKPSASAALATCCEPGTISARTPLATLPFFATSAAMRRSDRRPLVHEPTNATSIFARSEEHTSELQSRSDLVCRLLLEKKKKDKKQNRLNLLCQLSPAVLGYLHSNVIFLLNSIH